jgi:hypothetical protein
MIMNGSRVFRHSLTHCFRLSFLTLMALCIGIGIPSTSQAQSITPGTRVRVVSGDSLTIGHVARSTADSVVIGRDLGGGLAFSWSDIDRVEYSGGTRGNAGRGALIGAGVMTFLSITSIIFDEDDDFGVALAIIALPMTAAFGAGIGAIAGLAVRSERWNILPIGLSSGSGQYNVGVALAIRW